jgi:hypothetical protein
MTRGQSPLFAADPPRRSRGRTRRAAEVTVRVWRTTGKVADADALAVSLLYSGADLLDDARADPDLGAYTRALVLGRVTEVARFVYDRVSDDADGVTLADLLAEMDDAAHTGPPD